MAELLGSRSAIDDRLGGAFELRRPRGHPRRCTAIPERPILVGHDPDFSELVASLCGAAGVPMRKGAFARIDVDRPLRPARGDLRWLVPPDLLKPDR